MKLKNGIEIISLEQNLARASFRSSFSTPDIQPSEKLAERLKLIGSGGISKTSQWSVQHTNDNLNFQNVNDVLPGEQDYIFVNFRALSKVIVPGHWIDWSKDNVLKDSVSLLQGATVYPNHNYYDINNWLGSVNQAVWDETGANANGIQGINAQYKIDALMSPRIARGLLMSPPAIHSTSMTVLFEFDYSHPDMAADDKWKFFRLLGEEVDGQIVRFIVTKIHEYWEASLVFQGADRLAKKYDDEEDFEDESLSAANLSRKTQPPQITDKEKTMKVTNEQKTTLGIASEGDDVPEGDILTRALELAQANSKFDGINLEELQKQAATATQFVEQQRKEVRRLACLAELGSEEGELDEFTSELIAEAGYDRLVKMQSVYEKKAADKFPKGRTSQENSDEIETAGGINTASQETVPEVGLHG